MITEQDVREAVAGVNPKYDAQALPMDAEFFESGLDSLDHASILLALQEKSGIEFPDDLDQTGSIRAILDYAKQQQAA